MGDPTVTISIVLAAQAALLACISRLRFRCVPDPETGKCVVSSGCSEAPLQHQGPEGVDAHEFKLGEEGPTVLLVSART